MCCFGHDGMHYRGIVRSYIPKFEPSPSPFPAPLIIPPSWALYARSSPVTS
jgi:hypothetical protein